MSEGITLVLAYFATFDLLWVYVAIAVFVAGGCLTTWIATRGIKRDDP